MSPVPIEAKPVAVPAAATWSALGIVYVVWGSTYLAIAETIDTMPPLVALGARFLVAALLMAGYLAVRRGPGSVLVPWREIRGAMVVGTLLLGGGIGMVTLGERYVPTGVAALIIAVVPLWAVVLRSLAGDRPSRTTRLGVLLGLVGLAVLVRAGSQAGATTQATSAQLTGWSIAIALGSAGWALGSFLQPRLSTPKDPSVLTFYEMLAGGLVLTTTGLVRGEHVGDLAGASARSWAAWAYLVVIGSLVAYSAYVWLLGNAPLSLVTTYAYVNPVVAVLLGWWLRSEPITLGIVAGGLVIVSAVVLVVSGERRPR